MNFLLSSGDGGEGRDELSIVVSPSVSKKFPKEVLPFLDLFLRLVLK